jgi:hypothetical protein
MIGKLSRREFIKVTGMLTGAMMLPAGLLHALEFTSHQYISCFYQFDKKALDVLKAAKALPNSPDHLHIFSHSRPMMMSHPDTVHTVHAAGESFKYAIAFDLHKFKGWLTASEEQLKQWALEFRHNTVDGRGPADYFAFNEMPTNGCSNPQVRQQVAILLKYLYQGEKGTLFPGVFYFTEKNLNPSNWQGDSIEFWKSLDDTCIAVVGEHYHNFEFVMKQSTTKLTNHLYRLPLWLNTLKTKSAVNIARSKYLVLHSSFYGDNQTGWKGLMTSKQDIRQVEAYFNKLVMATTKHPYGKYRIGFGPLFFSGRDERMLKILAKVLHSSLA